MKRLIFLLLIVTSLFAQEAELLFDKANTAFQEEKYTEAIKIYEEVINSGMASGKLYYNLGNAYYKNKEIGKAILYYEKAKLLMPENENLRFNLKLANVKVKDRIEVPPDSFVIKIHKKVINLFSLPVWSIIFSLLLLTAAILFFVQNLTPKLKIKAITNMIISLMLIAVFTLYPIYSKYSMEELTKKGVLVDSDGDVYAAPDAESTKLFSLHEGIVFTILGSDGNWVKIELIDGKQGWIPGILVGKI